MQNNDVMYELSTNFIEYAAAVNQDRAIPNATDGLKPVAKRILYGTFSGGYSSKKPYVKCARIVGDVMGNLHPHGDSSIYGALVRLAQPWVMRYPLIGFHGNMGNQGGDGPAAARYTEARLSTLVEDGMLEGIKKNAVDFIPNYDESSVEPVELPSIFPNLLCNPNSGIGVAMACNWAPHNLKEVAQAIYDYIDGKIPTLPGPDFPTGGIVINAKDIPEIMRTGHGSVKIRAKHEYDKNNIIITELPYGVGTEDLITQIGKACEAGDFPEIEEIRDESNRKSGLRIVIECIKGTSLPIVVNKLFNKTNLQTSFSYNQVALVNKTPTDLNLKDCIKIYVDYNCNCIVREAQFDIDKATKRLHIILGLIKAMDIIDEIIAMIKASESAATAKVTLQSKWGFSEEQAKAILDMKLSKLAKLEKEELESEKKELEELLIKLQEICLHPQNELRKRLQALVIKYGDDRRTKLDNIEIVKDKEEKVLQYVEPEKVVVLMTESGLIKRVPAAAFKEQKRNGKGVKNKGDIVSCIIKTNTVDSLMIFSNKGKMYRLLVNSIPSGTNATEGIPIKNFITMDNDENPVLIYSIYRNTDAQYVLFTTKKGLVKKTLLEEYINTKKSTGIAALGIKDGDALANVNLIKDENIMIITKKGRVIQFSSKEIGASGRTTSGVKGIALDADDEVITTLVIRDTNDSVGLFTTKGYGKKVPISEFNCQRRGGKGVYGYTANELIGSVAAAILVTDKDLVLIMGPTAAICIAGQSLTSAGRGAEGTKVIKGSNVTSVSKV